MHVVTVVAGNIVLVHFTLDKRPINVILVQDLAVGIIELGFYQLGREMVQHGSLVIIALGNLLPAHMAPCTFINQFPGTYVLGHVQMTVQGVVNSCGFYIVYMLLSWTMASLAAHIDQGILGVVAPVCGIVILTYVRRVAIRAHIVPVHGPVGPVQPFGMHHLKIRIEVEPFIFLRIPRRT
jgi:hypothetical protein